MRYIMKRMVNFRGSPSEMEKLHLFLIIIRDMMKLGITFDNAIRMFVSITDVPAMKERKNE